MDNIFDEMIEKVDKVSLLLDSFNALSTPEKKPAYLDKKQD